MRRQKALLLNEIERTVYELAAQKEGINFNQFCRAAMENRAREILGNYIIEISAEGSKIKLPNGDEIKIYRELRVPRPGATLDFGSNAKE